MNPSSSIVALVAVALVGIVSAVIGALGVRMARSTAPTTDSAWQEPESGTREFQLLEIYSIRCGCTLRSAWAWR